MTHPNHRTRDVWAALTQRPHLSIKEIMRCCGLSSTSVARYHVLRLVAAGYITRQAGRARTTRVIVGRWETP